MAEKSARRVSSAVDRFDVIWLDKEREPECESNPLYPNGIDIDASEGAAKACTVSLPYPAERCGVYVVTCKTCAANIALTTAGRADDPRSVKFPCKGKPH